MSSIELTERQKEFLEIGKRKGLIKIEGNRIEYVVQKKSYVFTDPEEPIRAVTYIELVERLKYPPNRIDFEIVAPAREPPYPADIVVYKEDEKVHAYIVVETKGTSKESDIEVAKKEGLGNANLLLTDYLLTVCGEEEAVYYVKERPSLKNLENYRRSELPVAYGKETKYKHKKGGDIFSELREVNLNELHGKFQRCHDSIWEGGKRDPAEAFDEMSKLMFTKIYDEKFTKVDQYYKFQIGSYESPYIVSSRVKELYEKAQEKEPEVFKEKIKVLDEIIFEVVGILQDISLTKTDLDSKGQAFEKFLGKVFRGELGQFFTPREIIDFMVKFLNPKYDELVMDPACGSSGFLLYSIKHVMDKSLKEYGKDPSKEIVWEFSHNNVFGIDINDRIARIAMMDMVIHDDGHTNIECNDALIDYKHFDPRRDIRPGKYHIVFTNPPFGAIEKRQEVLKQFELGSKRRKRNSQKKEILFIERCLDLLKPSGRMGIVLPDGVLTNSSLQYVRDFIEEKAKILAIVSLPQQTFVPFGSGVKASLLFLQKKREGEKLDDYPIFMSITEHVGYDATGRPDENDLPKILEDWERFKRGELE